jgi:tRNA(Ile)-lysidine synthetase-like protein
MTASKNSIGEPQQTVVVLSVSGGCDSVAMLHACMELRTHPVNNTMISDKRIEWHVIHFHHRQRNKDADLDCQLVQELVTKEYDGIHFSIQDWNDPEHRSSPPESFSQDAARRWRRQRLLKYTQEQLENHSSSSIGFILTAHHKDDSTESLLLKMLRGVHILNLSGISTITSISEKNILLARPCLTHSKEELKRYLKDRQKTWREDQSNASPKYLRNRVRNELIPLLKELSPNLDKRLERMVCQSQELQEGIQPQVTQYLNQVLTSNGRNNLFSWRSDGSDSLLIQSQALYQWMNQEMQTIQTKHNNNESTAVSYDTLQRVMYQLRQHPKQVEWTLELGNNFNIERKGTSLQVTNGLSSDACLDEPTYASWNWSIKTDPVKSNDIESSDSLVISLSQEAVTSRLQFLETTLRELSTKTKSALKFLPPWKSKTSSPINLRQFLRGQDVPMHERDGVPILVSSYPADGQTADKVVAVNIQDSWIVDYNYKFDSKNDAANRILLTVSPPQTKYR